MLQFNKEGEKMKINEELFDYFKQVGTIKHYQKNEIIYMQDDCADELCLVLKGRVRVYHIKKNGDEINYDVLDKGRIFGESSLYENAYRPTTVSAINDVEIITCHLQDLYPYLSSSLDLTISLLKMLNDTYTNITINCIRVKKELFLPILENKGNEINHIVGPLSRNEMRKIMNTTDIYVDASLNEGFGLLALESIYAGAVPVVSDSFGVDEYLKDGVNGLIVNRVNDVDCYLEKIDQLMSDVDLYHSIQKKNHTLVKEFDYDLNAEKMVEYFSQELKRHEYLISEAEKDVFEDANRLFVKGPEKTKKLEFAIKVWKKMPNGMKRCFLKFRQYIDILDGLETLRNE